MSGIRLAALFSYSPNKLGYCGPKDADKLFYDYLKNETDKDKVKNSLSKFEALYPYLKVIAAEHGKEPFDYDVVEAYWLGNKLSEVKKETAVKLINMLAERGLLSSIAESLTRKINDLNVEKIPLTHLFHVLFVGVGSVTGSVPNVTENVNKCRTSWGTVKEIGSSLIIDTNKLEKSDGRYYFSEIKNLKLDYNQNLFPDLAVNDTIAIHWEYAVKKLDSKELNNLKSYTKKVIELIPSP